MQTILIIESKPLMLRGLEILLQDHYKPVNIVGIEKLSQSADSGASIAPNLILMGICEDKTSHPELISETRKQFPDASVVVFDQSGNFDNIQNCFQNGAIGYLSRSSTIEELTACIDSVLQGNLYLSSEGILHWLTNLRPQNTTLRHSQSNAKKALTNRQREIADLLVQGLRISIIANKLGIKVSTASTIKKTIFNKLEIDSVIGLQKAIRQ